MRRGSCAHLPEPRPATGPTIILRPGQIAGERVDPRDAASAVASTTKAALDSDGGIRSVTGRRDAPPGVAPESFTGKQPRGG
jgi:hypothetical protein